VPAPSPTSAATSVPSAGASRGGVSCCSNAHRPERVGFNRSRRGALGLPREPFGLGAAIDLRGDGRILFTYATRDGRGALYETGGQWVDVPALRLATG
jgi:hypothetical protein